nr:hypothetical protein [uncultured Flavobacterium sp.]
MRITSARITPLPRPMPQGMFDKMPEVHVKTDDGREHYLFQYYPDEISFTEKEFIGLTLDEARRLKFKKDKAYLQS